MAAGHNRSAARIARALLGGRPRNETDAVVWLLAQLERNR